MLLKSFVLALALTVSGSGRRDSYSIEELLPTTQWVLENLDRIGQEPTDNAAFRERLEGVRARNLELNLQIRELQIELRQALETDVIDSALIEDRFARLLVLEEEVKRMQFRTRVQVLQLLTPEQRQQARSDAGQNILTRQDLRRRIERIRVLGGQLRERGGDYNHLRNRLPEVERMIRAGRLLEALKQAESIARDIESELRQ